jgi:hypothetical protein
VLHRHINILEMPTRNRHNQLAVHGINHQMVELQKVADKENCKSANKKIQVKELPLKERIIFFLLYLSKL